MAKRLRGWLWMIGASAAIIAIQAIAQGAGFTWFDRILNSAHGFVPVGITLAVVGAILLLVAMIHGIVVDPNPILSGSMTLDGRVVTDPSIKPGKVAINYAGRTVGTANQWVMGFFRGRVLFSRGFYEETRMGDLKRSWRSGEWLRVHRYLRATLGLAGFLSLVTGLFVIGAILNDTTVIRLLFLLLAAYVLGGTAYAFARAR